MCDKSFILFFLDEIHIIFHLNWNLERNMFLITFKENEKKINFSHH